MFMGRERIKFIWDLPFRDPTLCLGKPKDSFPGPHTAELRLPPLPPGVRGPPVPCGWTDSAQFLS